MVAEIPKEQIKGYECKHAVYRSFKPRDKERDGSPEDIVFIKENIHATDGRIIPNTRIIKNYQRSWYSTKEGFRNHNDKKEWEVKDRLQEHKTFQWNLTNDIARKFNRPGANFPLRKWCNSPYIYGADVTTPVLIKNHYRSTWNDCISKSTVAGLDIETDMVWGTKEIISIAVTYKEKVFIGCTEKFVGTFPNIETAFREALNDHLRKEVTERKIKVEFVVAKDPALMCIEAINRLHEWQPDFVSIWNMDFDLPKIIGTLEDAGYDIGDVFSDPKIPPKYRRAFYKKDRGVKVTQSGKSMPKHPADQWHTMDCLASFYFIDSMALYKKLRVAKGNEPNYKLDSILKKILNVRKLVIPGMGENHDGKWHTEMQQQWKAEYLVYMMFDSVSLEMLDEKTNDLSLSIGEITGASEFSNYPSIPRRTVDKLHFYVQEHNHIIGTTSEDMVEDLDDMVISMKDWIVTLASFLADDMGISLFTEMPEVKSLAVIHAADMDCVSTYPTSEEVMNISKETTRRELASIEGIDEEVKRFAGINLTGGKNNALEIVTSIMGFPQLDDLWQDFAKEKNLH